MLQMHHGIIVITTNIDQGGVTAAAGSAIETGVMRTEAVMSHHLVGMVGIVTAVVVEETVVTVMNAPAIIDPAQGGEKVPLGTVVTAETATEAEHAAATAVPAAATAIITAVPHLRT